VGGGSEQWEEGGEEKKKGEDVDVPYGKRGINSEKVEKKLS